MVLNSATADWCQWLCSGSEQRDAGRMHGDDRAGGVQQLLLGNRALLVGDAVDRARRDLAAATDLQVAGPRLMCTVVKRSALALLGVLRLEVRRHLLRHVG